MIVTCKYWPSCIKTYHVDSS